MFGELQQDPSGTCDSAVAAGDGEFDRLLAAAQGVGSGRAYVFALLLREGFRRGQQLVAVFSNFRAFILYLLQLRHHRVPWSGAAAGSLRREGAGASSRAKSFAALRGSPLSETPLQPALLLLGLLSHFLCGGVH